MTLFLLSIFPLTTSAYPLYVPSSDPVKVAPYDSATSGAANWGATAGADTRDFITIGQRYRIRQDGDISHIRLHTVSKPASLTGFYFTVWREVGDSLYDLVGMSDNIIDDLVAGNFSTVELDTPISGVLEGDYYGYRIENNTSVATFFARTSVGGVTTYYLNNSNPDPTGYAWKSQTSGSNIVFPIEIYMTAPQSVFIGDSIIAGREPHYSFLETSPITDIDSTIQNKFKEITGYSYQNMGIGSQTTTQISNRFAADVLASKPRIAVIQGGVNDIAGSSISKETFLANWTSMLNAAQSSADIKTIVVIRILPWTNGSNQKMQQRDEWNDALEDLASGYSKAVVVNADPYVGQFRAGGDEGNLWDIKPQYNGDGVHFNEDGHAQIAQAIADSLPKPFIEFDNDFSQINSGEVAVNFNLIQVGGGSQTIDITNSDNSGVMYSINNGLDWHSATLTAESDNIGLLPADEPGHNYSVYWDSLEDLPYGEYENVLIRIEIQDVWFTSDSFVLINTEPEEENEQEENQQTSSRSTRSFGSFMVKNDFTKNSLISDLLIQIDVLMKMIEKIERDNRLMNSMPEKLICEPYIKFGSTGENVKILQKIINVVPADGIFGSQTLNALKDFQKSKKIPVDGIAGPQTCEFLQP